MSTSARISYYGSQVRGDHWRQEDAYGFLAKDDWILALIADGCGGRLHGREASGCATRHFRNLASAPGGLETPDDISRNLTAWAEATHRAVMDESVQPDQRPATTLIAARVSATDLHYVSVGDSLLFVTDEGRLRLLPSGRLSERNAVGLGIDDILLGHVPLTGGDRVMLATDGLYPMPDYAPDFCKYMRRPLAEKWPDKDIVKAALDWSQRMGFILHRDNCTVLCVTVPEVAP